MLSEEVTRIRVVPVENYYAVIAEVEAGQLSGGKLRVGVSSAGDSILKDGEAPRVMRLE